MRSIYGHHKAGNVCGQVVQEVWVVKIQSIESGLPSVLSPKTFRRPLSCSRFRRYGTRIFIKLHHWIRQATPPASVQSKTPRFATMIDQMGTLPHPDGFLREPNEVYREVRCFSRPLSHQTTAYTHVADRRLGRVSSFRTPPNPFEQAGFQFIIGGLMYTTVCTSPGIAFAASFLPIQMHANSC